MSWNTCGLLGSAVSSQVCREQKQKYFKLVTDKNNVICPQETLGKDEFLQALQVLHTQFRMFRTFVTDNVNAAGSAIFIPEHILSDHAVVTHDVTCQGRDDIIRLQSGENASVVINVHFEPDLILRSLREKLRRIASHWPRYPEGFRNIFGDLHEICGTLSLS